MNRRISSWTTSFFVLCALSGGIARAQSSYGTIAGTVTDATGAAIPGAAVTVTSLETNAARTVTTGDAGNYRLEAEQPGSYRVDVTAASFAKTSVTRTDVSASVITSVNIKLTAGSATETVEVTGDVAALKTESGELSETLSTKEINTLPISSLNPYSLALTLPGVSMVTAADDTNGPTNESFAVNGNRPRDNNFLIEGVDNNDQGIHGQAFQPENLEAISEVTFLLDSFSAEYGRGGAVSNVLLKSGSNVFHGAIYERIENSSLDATDKNDVLFGNPKSKTRENIFGFRFGGPVIKDRLFFFVSNQWDRFRATSNLQELTLPTSDGYTTLNQYASNARIANLVKAYGGLVGVNNSFAVTENLGLDPVTNANRGVVNFAGVQRSLGNLSNSRELEATSDFLLSDKDKFRFRFIQSPNSVPYDTSNFPSQLPGFDTDQQGTVYNAGITETHIFNPKILNELRLSWDRIGFNFDLRPETYANPLALAPQINISGITGYGIPAGSVPQGRFQDTYQLQDALSITNGRNSLKMGIDLANIRIKDGIPFNVYGSINYEEQVGGGYSALADYLDDYSGAGSNSPESANIDFGNPTARPKIWSQNYYVQDSYQVMPNLEVDAGIRYEYNGTPFNYLGYPAIDVNNPAAFPQTTKQVGDKNNFGPRLGFNYTPIEGGKTVISGGFGVFYSHVFSNIIDNIQGSSPNAAAKDVLALTSGRGSPNWSQTLTVCSTCAITTTAPLALDTANVIASHLLDPLTYEYNLRVQHELPGSLVAAITYVGNRSEHQYATEEYNPFEPSGARLIPTRGRIILEDNQGDSNYNAGQLELAKKERHGVSFRAVYTYSKNLDDGSEIFTDAKANGSTYAEIQRTPRAREYAASLFDHRHRFVFSGVWQAPLWHPNGDGMRVVAAIVNGFTFSGINSFQSGQPVNVEIGYDWNGDGIGNDRPILLNKNAPITNWAVKGEDFFNVPAGTLCDGPRFWATSDNCQVVQAANTHWVTSHFGTTENTVGRNYLFTDHVVDTDLTVERTFKTFKSQSFSIRAEAFDVLNQGNTGSSGGNFNASLISGVPFNGTDSLGNVYTGQTTFDNRYVTTAGGRTLRFFGRYEF